MTPYTVTYNMTLTIEVQADSADEADRELPSHCDVDCVVVCHRIATSAARTREAAPR